MDLGSILPTILENLAKLLPVRMIHDYEQGVRWTLGKPTLLSQSGPYFFAPFIQSIGIYDVTEGPLVLGAQPLQLKNNGTAMINSGLNWRIYDAALYATQVGDADSKEDLCVRARGIVAQELLHVDTLEEIRQKKSDLEEKIRSSIDANVHPLGIEILAYHIAELAATKVYHFSTREGPQSFVAPNS